MFNSEGGIFVKKKTFFALFSALVMILSLAFPFFVLSYEDIPNENVYNCSSVEGEYKNNYSYYEYCNIQLICKYYGDFFNYENMNRHLCIMYYNDSHLFYTYIQRIEALFMSLEWREMYIEERLVAIALTEEEIVAMSTETLIRATIENPIMTYLFLFNSFQQGFERIFYVNPGLRELTKRTDFFDAFISEYMVVAMNLSDYALRCSADIRPRGAWSLSVMEIVMAQPEMHQHITSEQAANMVDIFFKVRANEVEKHTFPYVFLSAVSEIEYSTIFDRYISMQITPFNFLVQIRTPRGSIVLVENRRQMPEMCYSEMWTIISDVRRLHPNAVILRNPTRRWNCHSFSLHDRSGSGYWLNGHAHFTNNHPSSMTPFFTDGSLRHAGTSPGPFDIIEWFQSDHTGVVISTSNQGIWVESKWGFGPLVRHLAHDSPYSGGIQFWRWN